MCGYVSVRVQCVFMRLCQYIVCVYGSVRQCVMYDNSEYRVYLCECKVCVYEYAQAYNEGLTLLCV